MIEKKLFYFIVFSLTIFSCSNQNHDESRRENKNFTLNKIREITIQPISPDSNIIGRLRTRFVANRDDDLFVFYDEIARQFIITDNQGVIQSVISGKGRGPGEIVRAGGYNFDEENRLVVYDEGQMRITIFNLDGDIEKTAKIESNNYQFGGRNLHIYDSRIYTDIIDQSLLGDLSEAWQSDLIGVYNYDGNLLQTLGQYDPAVKEANTYLIFPHITIDYQNDIVISAQSSGYQIQSFDLKSKKRIARFGRKTSNFQESEEYISPNQSRQKIREQSVGVSFVASVHSLSDYIILHFENLTELFFKTNNFNDKKHFVSIYDKETYNSYGDIPLPFAVGNIFKDKFYLIEDDNPDNYTIGVYELVEEE